MSIIDDIRSLSLLIRDETQSGGNTKERISDILDLIAESLSTKGDALGYKAENIIGVGINGGEEAKIEFEKASPTGFWGSMFLSGDSHGYHDAKLLYEWIKDGKEPPLDYRLSAILLTRDNFKEYMD